MKVASFHTGSILARALNSLASTNREVDLLDIQLSMENAISKAFDDWEFSDLNRFTWSNPG